MRIEDAVNFFGWTHGLKVTGIVYDHGYVFMVFENGDGLRIPSTAGVMFMTASEIGDAARSCRNRLEREKAAIDEMARLAPDPKTLHPGWKPYPDK